MFTTCRIGILGVNLEFGSNGLDVVIKTVYLKPNHHLLLIQHAALGGSSASSGGPTFADVLSSSYGLALNDFRGQDDSSRDSGGMHGHGLSGSQPCDTFNHGPESGYSQSDGAGTHIDQLLKAIGEPHIKSLFFLKISISL